MRRIVIYKLELICIKYIPIIVALLSLLDNILKYVGEKFSMAKAKEVCERYRGVIPQSFTHADVYVAINEHYHNCSELFKSWFGEDIDQKVIEAAILFWFKDDDCKSNSKLWNHFKEN